MAVKIDDKIIEYVGILAKLNLSEEEKKKAGEDMSRMLEYIGQTAGCRAFYPLTEENRRK